MLITRLTLLVAFVLVVAAMPACTSSATDLNISHYTCPMHPEVVSDKPGQCPICGMTLVPVTKDGASPPAGTMGHSGHEAPGKAATGAMEHHGHAKPGMPAARGVTINATVIKNSGIATTIVEKKTVAKKLRTFGRVAFDPQLAVAQADYLQLLNSFPELRKGARKRLKILGMSDEEITTLKTTRRPVPGIYLPDTGDPVWIYASVFDGEFGDIADGTLAEIEVPGVTAKSYAGVVKGIDPVVDAATRAHKVRIEVKERDEMLMPGMAVDVVLSINLGEQVVIPRSAYIDTGERVIAYVVHDGGHYIEREIQLGAELAEYAVVLAGLSEGEVVVSKALFLVDAEARLRGSVTGGHQH